MSANADVLTDTDWEGIRRRIAEIAAAIASGFRPSPDEERRILHARAQALSEELAAAEDAAGEWLEAVEFELASERYALPISQVKEVCQIKELTPVPCTPAFVRGLINLRGELCTVIDLKRFFDLPDQSLTGLDNIIIAQGGDMRVGILADAITGVRRIRLQDVQPGLPTLTGLRADYLRGVTSDRLAMLDADRMLSDERLFVEEEVSS